MKRWLTIAAVVLAAIPAQSASWLNSSWPNALYCTIPPSLVDEAVDWISIPLANFGTTFWSNVNSTDGRDVRVTAVDGTTQIAAWVDPDAFTDSGTTGTGRLYINSTSFISASVDGSFLVFFGNGAASAPSAGDTYGQYNVFDANTVAFYPLSSLNNAAENDHHLTNNNSATGGSTGPASGLEAYQLTAASSQYLSATDPVSNWPVTICGYFNITSSGATGVAAALSDSTATNNRFQINISTHPRAQAQAIGTGGPGSTASLLNILSTSTWYQISTSRDATTGTTSISVGGVGSSTDSTTIGSGAFADFAIGALIDSSVGDYFDGYASVVSVHDEVLSANYLSTMRNMFTNSAFVVVAPAADAYVSGATGWVEFTSAATVADGAPQNWANASNALTGLGSYAEAALDSEESYQLNLTNVDGAFSEVSGKTIDGIEIEVIATGQDGSNEYLVDTDVYIIKGGAVGGTNKAVSDLVQWTDAGFNRRVYGGSSDLWGLSWADTDITASGFGVSLQFENQDTSNADMRVYLVRARVHYSELGGAAPASGFFGMLN